MAHRWRAVTAEDCTFANVGPAGNGIAGDASSQKTGRSAHHRGSRIADAAPTPSIAYAVVHQKTDGARGGKSLGRRLQELFAKVGSFYPLRENFRLTPDIKEKFTEKLRIDPSAFANRRVLEVGRKDGLTLVLNDCFWVCYRLSGTEPVAKVSRKRPGEQELKALSADAKRWIFE